MNDSAEALRYRGPLVSIGIPCYNARETIEATLTDVLAQDHQRLEVIVSDNGSQDGTVDLCRRIAAGDGRVQLVEHRQNRGWQANFREVLTRASADYFMWLGADDRIAPRFVSANLSNLLADESLVGSVSRVEWLHDGRLGAEAPGTEPLIGSVADNLATYLRHARDNSRFYGLYRTPVLRSSVPSENFYGLDIAIMLNTLTRGGHGRVGEVLMWRERNDPAGYVHYVEADARGLSDRVLPFLRATQHARRMPVPLSPKAWKWLAVRNVYEHVRYWASTGTVYGRTARGVLPLLDRAREAAVTLRSAEGSPLEQP